MREEWEISEAELELGELLTQGEFHKLYKGKYKTKEVAAKVFEIAGSNIDDVRGEIKALSTISHPNIAQILGGCFTPTQIILVVEWEPRGTLEHLLHDQKNAISLFTRMNMIQDIIYALTWMYLSTPPIIHGNLKATNVLINQYGWLKVCDVIPPSLAELHRKHSTERLKVWEAPEILSGDKPNEKSDIYSFGVILWKGLTREDPFIEFTNYEEFKNAVCDNNFRPVIPPSTPSSIKQLVESCWQSNPIKRPSFPSILEQLNYIIIDCAIQDDVGRKMWKENFGRVKSDFVEWNTFLNGLFNTLDYYGDRTFLPLPEQPSANDIQLAHEFQLVELGSRSSRHQHMVRAEVSRKQTKSIGLSVEDTKIRFLKLLLLSVKNGDDTRELVGLEKFGSVLQLFGPMLNRKTKKLDFLDNIYNILSKPWFHGALSSDEASNLLTNKARGTFLVRLSSLSGCFTVSKVGTNHEIVHQRIFRPTGEEFTIGGYSSDSLVELINSVAIEFEYHQSCPGSKFMIDQAS